MRVVSDDVDRREGLRELALLLQWVHRWRYYPTTTEWLLLQDCFDDLAARQADLSAAAMFVLASNIWAAPRPAQLPPTRLRRAALLLRRYRVPLYVAALGFELGLRERRARPAVALLDALVALDSPLGERARELYVPEAARKGAGAALPATPSRAAPLSPEELLARPLPSLTGALTQAARAVAGVLTLEATRRSVFAGTVVGGSDGTLVDVRIATRFFRWRPLRWARVETPAATTHELEIDAPQLPAPRRRGAASEAVETMAAPLVRDRARWHARWWWSSQHLLFGQAFTV